MKIVILSAFLLALAGCKESSVVKLGDNSGFKQAFFEKGFGKCAPLNEHGNKCELKMLQTDGSFSTIIIVGGSGGGYHTFLVELVPISAIADKDVQKKYEQIGKLLEMKDGTLFQKFGTINDAVNYCLNSKDAESLKNGNCVVGQKEFETGAQFPLMVQYSPLVPASVTIEWGKRID